MKAKFSKSLVHIYGIESQQAFHEFHVSNTASLLHFVCSLCMGIVGTLAALLAQNRSRLEAADPVQLSGFTELCMLGPPCSGPSTPMKWAAKGVRFGRPGGTPNQLMAGTSGWLALQRFQTTAAILLLSVAFVHSIISLWGRLKYYSISMGWKLIAQLPNVRFLVHYQDDKRKLHHVLCTFQGFGGL